MCEIACSRAVVERRISKILLHDELRSAERAGQRVRAAVRFMLVITWSFPSYKCGIGTGWTITNTPPSLYRGFRLMTAHYSVAYRRNTSAANNKGFARHASSGLRHRPRTEWWIFHFGVVLECVGSGAEYNTVYALESKLRFLIGGLASGVACAWSCTWSFAARGCAASSLSHNIRVEVCFASGDLCLAVAAFVFGGFQCGVFV